MEHDERFPLHEETNAPEEAVPTLQHSAQSLGKIPNLEKVMASAPPLLKGYWALWDLFEQTSLTPAEQQVVYLVANFENNCSYCVPWHTLLAKMAKLEAAHIAALRAGTELPDSKLNALAVYSRALIEHRGHPPKEATDAFFAAGYGPQQALEVVLGLAVKVMSNYTNGIAGTPLDEQVEHLKWTKPS
ncbi:MAG: carboxymuconolactone decarboxylase family protein [Verrucomicrobiota bacterium]